MKQAKEFNNPIAKINQHSSKLDDVCYDIRGPVLEEAKRLEKQGHEILKLNIGNPASFGFNAPKQIISNVSENLASAQGYSDSKGLVSARKAISEECKTLKIRNVDLDDIYLGNGVSELITMSLQALLNDGDEVLLPAPDYPIWTASVILSGGNPVHYICDENSNWYPSLSDIESKINSRTRAIVIINPNNPTGAVYDEEILLGMVALARKYKLILFADEIYSKIVYDDAKHVPLAALSDDVFTISFNGLSKSYKLAGFRSGWMVLSGPKHLYKNYVEGLEILTNMRLCANVPGQFAVQTALNDKESSKKLTLPGGRLKEQRDVTWELLNQIPGISCVKPMGAIYLFPKLDQKFFNIEDDEKLILNILEQEKILLVQGSAFNISDKQHFRIVFLPEVDQLAKAINQVSNVLDSYRKP
ncbi:MAG: pyridoxal phosphate-dependent aminotransferase [Gammaproteobacteria bacterium]|nr:pyridoxal phosphate-dependent aminotransferase [Gammaproteobacteria bacterium]